MTAPKTILWLRKDLRLDDNAALKAASDGPVLPLFIFDEVLDGSLGAAARLRLRHALAALARDLEKAGAPLVLARGEALPVLRDFIARTGADRVVWTRLTDGAALARDRAVKAALKDDGVAVESFGGFTLLDPWVPKTGAGGPFKVFTPFSRAVMSLGPPAPVSAPGRLHPFPKAPDGLALDALDLDRAMGPAAESLSARIRAGASAAADKLEAFLDGPGPRYGEDRDRLDRPDATTDLSDNLAWGEISPRRAWAMMDRAAGDKGVEAARRQLVWRDFAHHLLFHDPEMERENWRREWSAFPWRDDNADAAAWRRGRTGVDIVDAAMRELWVTGKMHNRARMLTASLLTKNLLTHWRVGEAWFRDTLIDWDPANNAMGWQWVAGCGPDAAPFFRIFNPDTQAEKFDKTGAYRRRWLGDGPDARAFLDTWPVTDVTSVLETRPLMVDLKATRRSALSAWEKMRDQKDAA